jgi:stage V sporulation protein D (sporulation-specific penicillin-binding protein)
MAVRNRQDKRKINTDLRIQMISILVLLFAGCLILRLYLLQIVDTQQYRNQANAQYLKSPESSFDRGTIYFTDKNGNLIPGATLQSGYVAALNPNDVTNPDSECQKLNSVIPVDCPTFDLHAANKAETYIQVATKVTSSEGSTIKALNLPGINLYADTWRYYPGTTLAAHVLGFLSYQGDTLAARYGLEKQYDSVLARTNGDTFVNFFAEVFSDIGKIVNKNESLEGDVVTTIEPTTQSYLESILQGVMTDWHSDSAGGIIINPMNGEIYAMALNPTFDPNNYQDATNNSVYSDDLVERVYEMGSIIKPLTMSAGIDTGVINANTMYDDTPSVTVNNKTIYNFDKRGRGEITLQEALGESLNVGFVFAEKQIGNVNFAKYMKSFGLGQKTGIDLPNETSGLISNLDSPRDIEYATASFGQGIAMTPIETVRALSAIANGGTLITPHLVKQINYKLGYSKTITYPPGPRVMKQSTSEAVTDMMIVDFDKYFQNGAASNPHYSIGEKTGTAQIPLPGGGGYGDEVLHSFVGFLPAKNPQFLVFLYTVNPHGTPYASGTLGPAFVNIEKFLINYYQLQPDR